MTPPTVILSEIKKEGRDVVSKMLLMLFIEETYIPPGTTEVGLGTAAEFN